MLIFDKRRECMSDETSWYKIQNKETSPTNFCGFFIPYLKKGVVYYQRDKKNRPHITVCIVEVETLNNSGIREFHIGLANWNATADKSTFSKKRGKFIAINRLITNPNEVLVLENNDPLDNDHLSTEFLESLPVQFNLKELIRIFNETFYNEPIK